MPLWQVKDKNAKAGRAMKAEIVNASRPAQHSRAVVFCCDEKYLSFAAFAISSLFDAVPAPDFDICIVSLDELGSPKPYVNEVRMCQIDVGTRFSVLPTSERFSVAAYLRLVLAEAFAQDYDRILYLDCDVLVEGARFANVFDLDIGDAPIGAVMDVYKDKGRNKQTADQRALGINGPYFNSGVLLIDCKAFVAQRIADACIDVAVRHSEDQLHFDQTLLNVALAGKWAQLHPAWNWQWEVVRPQFASYVDPQVTHFLSATKPWTDAKGALPIRYRERARSFFGTYYPDLETNIAPPSHQLRKSKVLARLLKHAFKAQQFVEMFNRHGGDIMKVLPPSKDKVPFVS
jgi:lipopolysaccharide biosynthesis glycosyltransferase